MARSQPFTLGGQTVLPGERTVVRLEIGHLITHETVTMPVHVLCGRKPGPRVFVSAAVHGDEINGVEAVRMLAKMRIFKQLRGTLILVPVVNVPAFVARSRYLPDRRDLNRLFPGSARGSLGARLAKAFAEEVIAGSTLGIDLHTGAVNRPNLPQVRVTAGDSKAHEYANAFGAPVVIGGGAPQGSLRASAGDVGVPVLTYEGGEALRISPQAVRCAVRGVLHVLRHIGALPRRKGESTVAAREPVYCTASSWARATAGGVFTPRAKLGQAVARRETLAKISDPFGDATFDVTHRHGGIIIGGTTQGVVDEGDGVFHIARTGDLSGAEEQIENHRADLAEEADHPVIDDDFTD